LAKIKLDLAKIKLDLAKIIFTRFLKREKGKKVKGVEVKKS